jgi:hypothetical protein
MEFKMKNTNKIKWINLFIIALFLAVIPLAGAYAACCKGHGGVASCDKTTGKKICKDGTTSPTCTCPKEKTAKAKTKKHRTKSETNNETAAPLSATIPPTPKAKPKSNWWFGGQSTATTPKNTSKNPTHSTSTKGCCSRHGGVAHCNTGTGYLMCKDGTQSASCTCH